jgi:hypothetical protein
MCMRASGLIAAVNTHRFQRTDRADVIPSQAGAGADLQGSDGFLMRGEDAQAIGPGI